MDKNGDVTVNGSTVIILVVAVGLIAAMVYVCVHYNIGLV